MSALVSVCIPAYNADKYISKTLSSVREQSFTDWELIVTEDGSKDNTEELVNEFKSDMQQRILYQRHENNQGLPATRNSCIKKAKGKYIALLDADDYWAPDHLQSIVTLLEQGNAEIVHSGSILFDEDLGRELSIRAPTPEQINEFPLSLYNHYYIIQPSSAVIACNVFDRIQYFDLKFKICDDMDFWFRAARNDCRIVYSGEQTCYYRKHGNALSSRSVALVEEVAWVYRKHLDWTAFSLKHRLNTTSHAFASAGRMNLRNAPDKAWRLFVDAWKLKPIYMHFLAYSILACIFKIIKSR
jgi:glycosyltransferase involved in cell wall biosynthesis